MGLRRDCRGRSGSAAEPNEIQEVGGVRAAAPRGWLILAGAAAVVLLAGGGCFVMAVPAALGPLRGAARCLEMYLPVANVWVSLPLLLALGFGVGVLSGMTGVGGAFLMTPLLMMMGVPASPAVGTGSAQVAGTAASGTLVHWRMSNVDTRLGLAVLSGALIGGTLGVHLVAMLEAAGSFDFVVKVIYILLSATIGTLMLRESLGAMSRRAESRETNQQQPQGREESGEASYAAEGSTRKSISLAVLAEGWPLQVDFAKAKVKTSLLLPFGLGLGVGGLAAVMGVGGGFILVPAMIYVLGIPTHVAVGTSLFQLLFMAANVGFQHAVTNHNVDVMLAAVLMVGAAAGSQVGGVLARRLDGCQLRAVLGAVVYLVMVQMVASMAVQFFSGSGAAPEGSAAPVAVQTTGPLAALGKMAVENAPLYGALSVAAVVLVGLGLTTFFNTAMPRIVAPVVKKLAVGELGWILPARTSRPHKTSDSAAARPAAR